MKKRFCYISILASVLIAVLFSFVSAGIKAYTPYIEFSPISNREKTIKELCLEDPLAVMKITSGYGFRPDPFTEEILFHTGVDLSAEKNTPIKSAADGVVVFSGVHRYYGNNVIIAHENGVETLYAHCERVTVETGKHVKRGEIVGLVGSSGYSTGCHLHFEVRIGGEHVDPMKIL